MPRTAVGTGQRDAGARKYTFRGRRFSPVRFPPFRYPGPSHYQRYHRHGRFPLPWIVAQNILNDWADYDLPAPPPDDEWVRYGPDLLEIDTGDGEIEDVIYGFFTEDTTDEAAQDPEEVPEPEPQPVSAEPPAAPISVSPNGLYNIGIAWSPSGAWAIRVGSTDEEAIANAIAACNAAANGGCTDSGVSVSDVTPFCYAIVGGGGSIFAARNAQAGNAVATAMQNCQASGNGDCAVQAADCNTHP